MTGRAVGVIRYVLLFTLFYYVLMTAFGLIVTSTGTHPSAMNIVGLLVASTCVALWFIRKNRRPFFRNEYLTILIGSVLVDLAMELGFVAINSGRIFFDRLPSMIVIFGGHALLLALAYSPWSWIVRAYSRRVASP
jgi:hypothetical protein